MVPAVFGAQISAEQFLVFLNLTGREESSKIERRLREEKDWERIERREYSRTATVRTGVRKYLSSYRVSIAWFLSVEQFHLKL